MAVRRLRVFAKAFSCHEDESPEDSKRRLSVANPGSMVQAAKRDLAKNALFVELLAAQTLSAEASGCLLANKPEIDFLLMLAGTTQISKAIREAGARPGDPFVLVVAGRRRVRQPPGLRCTELPKRQLGGSELGRIERAALLNAKRA
jgi:tRNA threonylcarbamoyladenosine modification (KEOPS) complex Cgi121 subunit